MMLPAGQYSSQRRKFGLVLLILVALLVLQNLEPACGSGTTPGTRSAARRMLSTSPLTPGFKHIGILGYWKDRDQQQFTTVKRRSLVVLRQAPVGYYQCWSGIWGFGGYLKGYVQWLRETNPRVCPWMIPGLNPTMAGMSRLKTSGNPTSLV